MSCNSTRIEEFLSREERTPPSFISWNPHHPEVYTAIDEREDLVIRSISEETTIQVDVKKKRLLRAGNCNMNRVKHSEILDLSVDGDRWEGDVLDDTPFGWGILYDKNDNKSYEGFRLGEVNVCFGCTYYGDIAKIEYDGMWHEGKRWGRGTQYDRKGAVIYEGYWMDDEPVKDRVEVTSDDVYFHNRIIDLVVGNSLWNDSTHDSLQLEMLPRLKSLTIGDMCCMNVAGLDIVNLNQLRQIEIGSGSFTATNSHASPRAFHVSECPKLKVLRIGPWSFSSYTECTIKRLPALEVIEIGDMDEASYNFYKSSIRVTGNSRGE